MLKSLAIDIGGTKIYSAVINEKGQILTDIRKEKTPKTLPEIVDLLKNIVEENGKNIDTVAIATAGAVNCENTKVISSTGNLVEGYRTIDFSSLSKLPVFVENDANSASYAEHVTGSGKGYNTTITITLGTGVGGGIILNNKLYKGKSGAAGEMHFKLSSDKKRKCTCGAYDCWEIYASGRGLELTAKELFNKEMTSYEIIEGFKNQNKDMTEVVKKWQDYIVMGCIGLSNIFDPDCIILSGSMAQFVNADEVEKNVNKEIVVPNVKIKLASAGNYSGMIGASLLAIEKLK